MALNKVTATDARIHFGELLQRVAQDDETILVERSGRPVAVIMPVEQYERMQSREREPDWKDLLAEAHTHIRAGLGNQAMIPADEIVRMGRDERSDRQLDLH